MTVTNVAMQAYQQAIKTGQALNKNNQAAKLDLERQKGVAESFNKSVMDSLSQVNEMQAEKSHMIDAFVSGEKQNVHELMISLQKAGMAMQMTSAVRNKLMESYKQIMQMPF